MTTNTNTTTFEIFGPNAADHPFSEGAIAGDLFFSSGITAPGDDDFAAETNRVIDELERRLIAVGSSLDRLVKVNAYLSDDKLADEFNAIYKARITGVRPPRTTIVTAFPVSTVRLEIEAIAYLG